MGTWRWYSKVLFGFAVLAFAYWVWPTPYARFQVYLSDNKGKQCIFVRENRFTGKVQSRTLGDRSQKWITFVWIDEP